MAIGYRWVSISHVLRLSSNLRQNRVSERKKHFYTHTPPHHKKNSIKAPYPYPFFPFSFPRLTSILSVISSADEKAKTCERNLHNFRELVESTLKLMTTFFLLACTVSIRTLQQTFVQVIKSFPTIISGWEGLK